MVIYCFLIPERERERENLMQKEHMVMKNIMAVRFDKISV